MTNWSVRSILARLRVEDAELLSYALEAGLTNTYVEYRPGRFVGVNVLPELMPSLLVEQTAGVYSAGAVLGPDGVENCNEDT